MRRARPIVGWALRRSRPRAHVLNTSPDGCAHSRPAAPCPPNGSHPRRACTATRSQGTERGARDGRCVTPGRPRREARVPYTARTSPSRRASRRLRPPRARLPLDHTPRMLARRLHLVSPMRRVLLAAMLRRESANGSLNDRAWERVQEGSCVFSASTALHGLLRRIARRADGPAHRVGAPHGRGRGASMLRPGFAVPVGPR